MDAAVRLKESRGKPRNAKGIPRDIRIRCSQAAPGEAPKKASNIEQIRSRIYVP